MQGYIIINKTEDVVDYNIKGELSVQDILSMLNLVQQDLINKVLEGAKGVSHAGKDKG